ncbi:hypothetical protein FZX15_00930 [Brucella suis bv. 1]|nr:hypothetical protein FZX15_00930 [Brucella suis bv. 1]
MQHFHLRYESGSCFKATAGTALFLCFTHYPTHQSGGGNQSRGLISRLGVSHFWCENAPAAPVSHRLRQAGRSR